MADRIVVYWRDIPAQIIIKAGRKTAKRELPQRFVQAIDRCAMKIGARDSDAYLAEWRKGSAEPVGDDLEAEADLAFQSINSEYDGDRLKSLVESEGFAE